MIHSQTREAALDRRESDPAWDRTAHHGAKA